jgi:hypothetical protein
MYPHERSLVKKFEKRPFSLLGVNSDRDREKIKQICVEKELTWRSFWNGGSTGGSISTRWNVSSWPTTYVLDHRGIIRAKNVRGPKLEEWIEKLVAEAEAVPPTDDPPQK